MKNDVKNKETGLSIKTRNKIPPGSYIIKDGKLIPNLKDKAMRDREKLKEKK